MTTINNMTIEFLKSVVEHVYEKADKNTIKQSDFMEHLEEMMDSNMVLEDKTSSKKKTTSKKTTKTVTRTKKEIPSGERCLAKTAKGDQCSSKRTKGHLCTKHDKINSEKPVDLISEESEEPDAAMEEIANHSLSAVEVEEHETEKDETEEKVVKKKTTKKQKEPVVAEEVDFDDEIEESLKKIPTSSGKKNVERIKKNMIEQSDDDDELL